TEGTIVELRVLPGQSVKAGETLAVVETDKVVTDMPSPVDGVVVEMTLVKGQVVRVGEVVARIRTSTSPSPSVAAAHETPHQDAGSVVGKLDTGSGSVLPSSSEGLSGAARAGRNGGNGHTGDGRGEGRAGGVRASPVARKL